MRMRKSEKMTADFTKEITDFKNFVEGKYKKYRNLG